MLLNRSFLRMNGRAIDMVLLGKVLHYVGLLLGWG